MLKVHDRFCCCCGRVVGDGDGGDPFVRRWLYGHHEDGPAQGAGGTLLILPNFVLDTSRRVHSDDSVMELENYKINNVNSVSNTVAQ